MKKPAITSISKWPLIRRCTRRRAISKTISPNFVRKAKAGADSAITQYFFNADSYFYFVERVRALGVNIPIVPGIMPITNYSKLARFSDACGAEIPRWIRKQLEAYGDDAQSIQALRRAGHHRDVRTPAARWCARAALLHPESG